MHLILRTSVNQPVEQVWTGFNRDLFIKLSPPFPPVEVVRFDGCLKGDIVQVRLNFLLFKQDWISEIIDQQSSSKEIYFIDEGRKLPFFLRYWRHCHRLISNADGSATIVDDIMFQTPFLLTDYLFYPVFWLQFAYRKSIYRRVFSRNTTM